MSEKVLEIFLESQFKDGIMEGVPAEYKEAHKYRIRSDENKSTQQLHDCGIVYDNNAQYLLCIMSKGQNIDDLKDSISKISEKIFNEIR